MFCFFIIEKDKKKRKEEGKSRIIFFERFLIEVKVEIRIEEVLEKKKEKFKFFRITVFSYVKFRFIGKVVGWFLSGVCGGGWFVGICIFRVLWWNVWIYDTVNLWRRED